ncbi:MAG: thioredoxin [Myxococcota bacterium]
MAQNVLELSDGNFQSEVLDAQTPVLVDFWAVWCGPCKAIAPHLESLATEMSGSVTVGKLNIDNSPNSAMQYNVRSIPTLILFKGGRPVDQIVGAVPKAKIEEMVKRHL